MPAGSSLTETNRVLEHVERILQSKPEVEITSRRTGLQMGFAAVTEANTGDFTVKLKAHRSRSVWDVMDEVRAQRQGHRAGARHRVHPGAAGQHQRPFQCARADPGQDLFRRRATAEPTRPARGRRDLKDPRRGGRGERHRQHHQRPGDEFSASIRRRRRGLALRPRRFRKMRPRFSTAFPPPIRSLPTAGLIPIRVRLGDETRDFARCDPEHGLQQQFRPHGDAGIAGHGRATAAAERDSSREPAAAGGGDRRP